MADPVEPIPFPADAGEGWTVQEVDGETIVTFAIPIPGAPDPVGIRELWRLHQTDTSLVEYAGVVEASDEAQADPARDPGGVIISVPTGHPDNEHTDGGEGIKATLIGCVGIAVAEPERGVTMVMLPVADAEQLHALLGTGIAAAKKAAAEWEARSDDGN